MMQGDRVKNIRKTLKLTLEEFGKKVGVTKQTVSRIENGVNNLTDQMARSICREYNVNYDYLIYGEGEIFDTLPQTTLDELCKQYNCDELDRSLIEEYLKLDPASRKVLKDYIKNILKNRKE
ncbi:MAG TPA: XRE family transcriptional regulator [Lachnospiraceae bacterium]|nr:helix-turn-helix transcriptional regulator [Eubacteriales bacterium]HBI59880.1 XRE family transcriptional regulator [Lachnospiraceae bacterium]